MAAGFSLHLESANRSERVDDVVSFVGNDASGAFGLLAHHARLLTVLEFGMARFRTADDRWHYVALPGAVAYFVDNALHLATRRYVLSDDYRVVADAVENTLRAEERTLRGLRQSVGRLDREILRRLWRLQEREA
ncbi:MAG: ATP synthase F0F1 subunit epsilon [Betaproteobacteria bacterium SG8_39]|nr:MAG: ATP synthase F0F1 subunit epsilon [Betaproteobacteria bacterium SG8_39]